MEDIPEDKEKETEQQKKARHLRTLQTAQLRQLGWNTWRKGGGFLSTPLNLKSWKSHGAYSGIRNKFAKDMANLDYQKHLLILFVCFCYGDFGCGEMPMVEFGNGFGFSKRWLNRWTSTWFFKGMSHFFGLFYFPLGLWLSKKTAPLVNILCFCRLSSVYLCFLLVLVCLSICCLLSLNVHEFTSVPPFYFYFLVATCWH